MRGTRRAALQRKIERPPHPPDPELLRTAAPPHPAPAAPGACACACPGASAGHRRPGCAAPVPPVRRTPGFARASAPSSCVTVAGNAFPVTSDSSADQHQVTARRRASASRAPAAPHRRTPSPLAISVVAVRMPPRCASTIPAFTSGVKPKSSAFTTSCFRAIKTATSRIVRNFLGLARMSFASDWNSRVAPVKRVVQLRVHHQLPQRALAGVDLVDGAVELGDQLVQPLVQRVVLQQLARRALARIEVRQQAANLREGRLRLVVQRGILQQFSRRCRGPPAGRRGWRPRV